MNLPSGLLNNSGAVTVPNCSAPLTPFETNVVIDPMIASRVASTAAFTELPCLSDCT
jgi:hypothetical protein